MATTSNSYPAPGGLTQFLREHRDAILQRWSKEVMVMFQRKGVEKMTSIMQGGATVIFVSHNLKSVSDLCHRCVLMDHGQVADKEAAMVKWYASEMAERVTSNALQILGGAGYTKLHAVERYWRDARLTKIFEGTSEIQLRIISDRLMGKPSHRDTA